MGDLAVDMAVKAIDEHTYEAVLSPDWEIWGPMGGYVAACALRAAGAERPGERPATFSCHYLAVARFEPVRIEVTTRRAGRTATSLRVEVSQQDRAILDASVWTTTATDGLEHDETVAPDVPGPDGLPDIARPPACEMRPERAGRASWQGRGPRFVGGTRPLAITESGRAYFPGFGGESVTISTSGALADLDEH